MTYYLTRAPIENLLAPLAGLIYGSAYFAISILVILTAKILSIKHRPQLESVVGRRRLSILSNPTTLPALITRTPTSTVAKCDADYHVTFSSPRPRRRSDAHTVISVVHPADTKITVTASLASSRLSVPIEECTPGMVGLEENEEVEPTSPSPIPERELTPKRPTLSLRFPSMKSFRSFKKTPRKSSQDSIQPEDPSPLQNASPRLSFKGTVESGVADNQTRKPRSRSGEGLRTTFVNALTPKLKRHSLPSSSSPTDDSLESASETSSPSSVISPSLETYSSHHRHRSLASYLSKKFYSHSRRDSVSSTPSSAASSSSSSRRFSFTSFSTSSNKSSRAREVPRTQPYGAPYFAPIPTVSVHARFRSSYRDAQRSGSLAQESMDEDPKGDRNVGNDLEGIVSTPKARRGVSYSGSRSVTTPTGHC